MHVLLPPGLQTCFNKFVKSFLNAQKSVDPTNSMNVRSQSLTVCEDHPNPRIPRLLPASRKANPKPGSTITEWTHYSQQNGHGGLVTVTVNHPLGLHAASSFPKSICRPFCPFWTLRSELRGPCRSPRLDMVSAMRGGGTDGCGKPHGAGPGMGASWC